MSRRITARRTKLQLLSFGPRASAMVETLAQARGVAKSRVIREALAVHIASVHSLPEQPIASPFKRSTRVHIGVRLGPVMAETIRARSILINASVSAIAEACCSLYCRAFLVHKRAQ
jgi:hypothetical protein